MAALRRALPGLARTLRRFAPHLRPQRWLLLGSVVAILFETLMRVLEPWPLKFVLDRVLSDEAGGGWLDSMDEGTLLAACAVAVVAFAAVRAGAAYLSTVGMALAGSRVLTEVRGDLFRHVQQLSLGFHARARAGDLITRLTGDVGRLQEVAVTAALPLVANVLTLVGMVGVMLWLDWQLTLLALAAFPLFSGSLTRSGGRIHAVSRVQRKREGELATSAAEALGAIRVVQTLGLEERLNRIFARQNQGSLTEGVQGKRLAAGLERRVDVFVGLGTGLVLFLGARRVQAEAMTPGDLVVFLLYLKTAFKPMRDMAKYTGRLARAAASGERILELLDTEPDIQDRPDAVDAGRLRGAIRLRRVSLRYADDAVPAVRDLDLDVAPGTRVALAGPSGSGKSSVLALLPRLYDATSGTVELDGRDVRDYTLASVRGQFAAVLQESVLFGVSVRENIAMGAPEASDEDVERAARRAGADAFVSALPQGYDTVLGERGATLSGGERQRIAIARAMVRDAPLILLDEPTTGLDEQSERVVLDALDRLCAGRTSVIVAHDLAQVRDADLIVYLEGGRVLERGTHCELLALDGAYAATWQRQQAERAAQPVPA
jgi:ATP-binding cassette subfamily B protein